MFPVPDKRQEKIHGEVKLKFRLILFNLLILPAILGASQTGISTDKQPASGASFQGIYQSSNPVEFPELSKNPRGFTRDFPHELQSPLPSARLIFRLRYQRKIYAQAETDPEEETGELEEEEEFEGELEEEFGDEFDEEESEEDFDPLSGYNRAMHDFNDWFYINVGFPVARGYRWVVPEGGRLAVKRFFDNLLYPMRFVNNVLQLKLLNAGEETLRFTINTTIGLLGFFDPAKSWFGLEEHDEDFGQTMGHYGVGGGFPIVLPILGHYNLRDALSYIPDRELDPLAGGSISNRALNSISSGGPVYSPELYQEIGVTVFEYLNEYSFRIEEYEAVRKDAIDFYLLMRNGTEQSRNKKIKE